jgi:phosphoglycerate dehydrogenase-like enzyme
MNASPSPHIQVCRLNTSPYWQQNFLKDEQAVVESFPQYKYFSQLKDVSEGDPVIWITNTHTDSQTLGKLKSYSTKLIIHLNSGIDNFPAEFVKASHFPILFAPTLRASGVAHYYLGALLEYFCLRPHSSQWDPGRSWPRTLLSDQKILIVGFGHVGQRLYHTLKGLGCDNDNIDVLDPYVKTKDLPRATSTQGPYSILLLTCSLNKQNHEFFPQTFRPSLTEDFVIINGARGELIHWPTFYELMEKNPKAHAYLDVFPNEPMDFSQCLKNMTCTSHIAGVDLLLQKRTLDFLKQTLEDFLCQKMDANEKYSKYSKYSKMNLINRMDPTKTFLF